MLVVPYYVSSALLRAGLTDYTFELGFERDNFTIESNDYGRGFGAARTGRASPIASPQRRAPKC